MQYIETIALSPCKIPETVVDVLCLGSFYVFIMNDKR